MSVCANQSVCSNQSNQTKPTKPDPYQLEVSLQIKQMAKRCPEIKSQMAKIPQTRQIAGAISGVARSLAVCINGVPSGLARALQQLADQKAA